MCSIEEFLGQLFYYNVDAELSGGEKVVAVTLDWED